MPFEEDKEYLSRLFGFINSKPFTRMKKPLLTEEEQKERLDDDR